MSDSKDKSLLDDAREHRPLEPSELSWRCPDEACTGPPPSGPTFGFGQERAVAALRFGIAMTAPGYHVFVTGSGGFGRRSTVEEIVRELAKQSERTLRDHVFVQNFEDPSRPRLLSLPKGQARQLERAVREMIREARAQIPAALEGDRLHGEREQSTRSHREKMRSVFEPFEQKIAIDGLVLVSDESAPSPNARIQALVEGRPVPLAGLRADRELLAAFNRTHPLEIADLERKVEALEEELEALLRVAQQQMRAVAREIESINRKAVEELLRELVAETTQPFANEEIRRFLEGVASHMVSNLAWFGDEETSPTLEQALQLYGVNVVRDASFLEGPPVLVEPNPSFTNLFGGIESPRGEGVFEFSTVRAGALLRADGGFLILQASDFHNQGVWRALLRTLRSGSLEIRAPEGAALVPSGIQPDPIAIDVKVILVGGEQAYQILAGNELDFGRVFKVKAEFEGDIVNAPEELSGFAGVMRSIQAREQTLLLHDSAIARLAEHAARLAGRQTKLSLNFGALSDVIREAHHLALEAGLRSIDRAAIQRALDRCKTRHDLLEREIDDELREGRVHLETSGTSIGQINALAVYDREPAALGLVTRVTASVGPGRSKVINIERESRLSGPLHDKGVGILTGYLLRRYRDAGGSNFVASIAFEQSHTPIDGDSASLAELCALLSALSEVPIAQHVAVTGAIDQCGNVQAVGGINEKLEAWFRATRTRGGAGPFFAVIPASNRRDLMLAGELVEAARERRLRIFAVDRVDDAIPILFGTSAALLHSKVESAIEALNVRAGSLNRRRA
jgi:predicted ATP-dependent protease